MPSQRRILEVYLESIQVLETGDRKQPEAQNTLLGLLNYPLPGRAEVMATSGLLDGLEDGKPLRFTPPRLFLKEFVQGPTELLFTVTDRDDRNRVVSFFRRLGSAVVGSAGEVAQHLVPGLLRAAFQEAVVTGRLAVSDRTEEKIEVVATGFLPIPDPDRLPGQITVALVAPRELKRRQDAPIAARGANGELALRIEVREP
jgi:hypothetical protein